jgi:hypothetical protein
LAVGELIVKRRERKGRERKRERKGRKEKGRRDGLSACP